MSVTPVVWLSLAPTCRSAGKSGSCSPKRAAAHRAKWSGAATKPGSRHRSRRTRRRVLGRKDLTSFSSSNRWAARNPGASLFVFPQPDTPIKELKGLLVHLARGCYDGTAARGFQFLGAVSAGFAAAACGSFAKFFAWARRPKFGVILEYPATSWSR